MGYSLTYSLESRDDIASRKTKTAENTIKDTDKKVNKSRTLYDECVHAFWWDFNCSSGR